MKIKSLQRNLSYFHSATPFRLIYPIRQPDRATSGHLTRSNSSFVKSTRDQECFDIIVVGGGIVGMATAMELSKRPHLKLAVVEKENVLAKHQSGSNSGVVHAGIYYKPDSLKAKLCVEGLRLAYDYFDRNQIPYKKCGKLIVAVSPDEIPRLKNLYDQGLKNNVAKLKLVSSQQIKEYEPHCQGLMAIWSPDTGIVDWGRVTRSFGEKFIESGGKVYVNFPVVKFQNAQEETEYPVLIFSNHGKVPDPRFPFLGVHFTPRMDGSVWLGPNAILAAKREGYSWTDFDIRDLGESLAHPGFQKMAMKYLEFGSKEIMRSAFIGLQLKQLNKYIPGIRITNIRRGPAGVRAQAVDSDGQLVEDFVFDYGASELGSRILHVRNAPSPGATSSLAIAKMIVEKIKERFPL